MIRVELLREGDSKLIRGEGFIVDLERFANEIYVEVTCDYNRKVTYSIERCQDVMFMQFPMADVNWLNGEIRKYGIHLDIYGSGGMNDLGRFLKKIRSREGENLLDMARKLGLRTPELSGIGFYKTELDRLFPALVWNIYNLSENERKELMRLGNEYKKIWSERNKDC